MAERAEDDVTMTDVDECCEEHEPSTTLTIAQRMEHVCPRCSWSPSDLPLQAVLYDLFQTRLGFSIAVADDLAERAADVALAWTKANVDA